jgi:16S rRNA (cytidine1402-2'-O)-methyltransferase
MVKIRSGSQDKGPCLYVCSTPIGNLGDATYRLVDILQQVDVILAEDTRHTRKLLSHFQIHPNQLMSYHEHNQRSRRDDLLRWWEEGKSVALVSDAGTPGVSDPGEDAIGLAIQHGVLVIPVPGPSAVITALVGSGFPMQPFAFFGFLPREKKSMISILDNASLFPGTLVFYEAPHRLKKTLEVMSERMGDRLVCLAKELTKRHETFLTGSFSDVLAYMEAEEPRGEYVVLLSPKQIELNGHVQNDAAAEEERFEYAISRVRQLLAEGVSHREAVKTVSSETGVHRKSLYQATLPTSSTEE